jgi:hypothetical protein
MATAIAYPINYEVDPQLTGRNRLTNLVRYILAFPQLMVVSVLGQVAQLMAVVSWFAIIVTGKQPKGLWDFMVQYMVWKAHVQGYSMLHVDPYPPFTFDPIEYPARFTAGEFPLQRDRLTTLLRLVWVIPHFIALMFIGIVWFVTVFIGWLLVVITASYPEGLYNFSVGFTRWSLRVEAYCLLMTDEYPPFAFT